MEWLARMLVEHADKLPFVTMAAKGNRMRAQVSVQGIIEAVITGLALALVGYVLIIPRLETRIDNIEDNLGRIEESVNQLRELRDQDIRDQRLQSQPYMERWRPPQRDDK